MIVLVEDLVCVFKFLVVFIYVDMYIRIVLLVGLRKVWVFEDKKE